MEDIIIKRNELIKKINDIWECQDHLSKEDTILFFDVYELDQNFLEKDFDSGAILLVCDSDWRTEYDIALLKNDKIILQTELEYLKTFGKKRVVDKIKKYVYSKYPKTSTEKIVDKERRQKEEAEKWIMYINGEPFFNFGKYVGESVKSILIDNPGYCTWVLDSNFPDDVKDVLRNIKDEQ